ncbi:MAG: VOC family protein [Candidatus Binataceae bacterium]
MLADNEMTNFVATTQPEKAKAFYCDVLGLKLVEDSWHAIIFTAGGRTLMVQKVREFKPLPFTTLGWRVADIGATMAELARRGVKFERYAELKQDDTGIWTTPDGRAKVCWFKDPDGNTLSLSQ